MYKKPLKYLNAIFGRAEVYLIIMSKRDNSVKICLKCFVAQNLIYIMVLHKAEIEEQFWFDLSFKIKLLCVIRLFFCGCVLLTNYL